MPLTAPTPAANNSSSSKPLTDASWGRQQAPLRYEFRARVQAHDQCMHLIGSDALLKLQWYAESDTLHAPSRVACHEVCLSQYTVEV